MQQDPLCDRTRSPRASNLRNSLVLLANATCLRNLLVSSAAKALDDQATAGSNTEDFLELCQVTEVRAKRAPLLTLADLARRMSASLGEDVPAVTLQGAVCKFMQVLSCFACGKTFSRAREEDSNQKWHVSSLDPSC